MNIKKLILIVMVTVISILLMYIGVFSSDSKQSIIIDQQAAVDVGENVLGLGGGSLYQFKDPISTEVINETDDTVLSSLIQSDESIRIWHLKYNAIPGGADTCSHPRATRAKVKELDLWIDAVSGVMLKTIIHSEVYKPDNLPDGWQELPNVQDCGLNCGKYIWTEWSEAEMDIATLLCSLSSSTGYFGDEIVIYRGTCWYGPDGHKKTPFRAKLGTPKSVGPFFSVTIRDYPRHDNNNPDAGIIRPTWAMSFSVDAITGEVLIGINESMRGEGIPKKGFTSDQVKPETKKNKKK